MQPLKNFYDTLLSDNKEKSLEMLEKLKVELSQEEKKLNGKELLKLAMTKWLPAADCILEMMIQHLPSPVEAQKYRTEYLYEGDLNDECATAMRNCDPKGPAMVYISKMVPDEGRFYAFGRIFSGTIVAGQKIRILGANFKPGTKTEMYEKNIQRVTVAMGRNFESIGEVPCGNTLALSGIDEFILKTGTLVSVEV